MSSRTPSDLNTNLSSYFTFDGTTLKLLKNIVWSSVMSEAGWSFNDYISLSANQVFDGQGFTIDLQTNNTDGLFTTSGTSLSDASIIKYLGVLNGTTNTNAGFIVRAYQQYFQVQNCYSTGLIDNNFSGGIAGFQQGTSGSILIDSCYSNGIINGTGSGGISGGRAGYNGQSQIFNSYSLGSIEGIGAGGIAGQGAGSGTGNCIVNACYTIGNINGDNAGGIFGTLAGSNSGSCSTRYCYSSGIINGIDTGGITGKSAGYFGSFTLYNQNYSNINSGNTTVDGTSPLDAFNDISGVDLNIMLSIINTGSNYVEDTFEPVNYPLLKVFRDNITWNPLYYTNYVNSAVFGTTLYPEPVPYKDQRHFFCSNMFYNVKKCDGIETLELPKKAKVYSKPSQRMSKSEFYKWTSRFKYR